MNHRNLFTRQRWTALALLCGMVWLPACAYPGGERDSKVETVELPRTTEILSTRASAQEQPMSENTIPVRVFDESGELVGPIATQPVVKTDEEWKAILTPEQFRVVRNEGTERPFCGNLLDNKKEGVYTCVACKLPLFASNSKFKSGTGWPSFFQPIAAENVHEERDETHGMVRVEIECARCKGHLGHVFEDGPRPTGLRYCLNSESLEFTGAEDLSKLADPIAKTAMAGKAATEMAETVFAGGCFWCVEAVIEELDGVQDAVSGYAGGSAETANYRDVCSGTTGHAEAVKVIYDPTRITYAELLQVHFATHDPTTLNRQGADRGTQYRSTIFYANDEEKEVAEAMIADLNASGVFADPIVTTLEPLVKFFDAEAKHQNYVCENPTQGYVRGVALPKVDKVRKKFADKLKTRSPLQQ